MKHFFLALFLVMAGTASAQYKVSIGARAGIGSSWLRTHFENDVAVLRGKYASDQSRVVPNAGLLLELDIPDSRFGALLGFGYRQRGFKVHEKTFDPAVGLGVTYASPFEVRAQMHYFSLDALCRYYFTDQTKVMPYATAGLRVDSKIGYSTKLEEGGINGQESRARWNTSLDQLNNTVLGAVAQLGMVVNKRFWLEVEYNPDLTRSFKVREYAGTSYEQRARSQVISLQAGWYFLRF